MRSSRSRMIETIFQFLFHTNDIKIEQQDCNEIVCDLHYDPTL